jgi:hypothetical protein
MGKRINRRKMELEIITNRRIKYLIIIKDMLQL